MRALEFSRPLVRVTNTGISSLISPRGEVLQSIAQFEQGVADIQVTPREGATPYVSWGNRPVLVWSVFIVLLGWLLSRPIFRRKLA